MNNIQRQKSWLGRFAKTSTALIGGIQTAIGSRKISSEVLEEIEETLILADLGHQLAADLVLELRARKSETGIDSDAIRRIAAEHIAARLMQSSQAFSPATLAAAARRQGRPLVLMMVGANGSGKTTTIGKLAAKFTAAGVKTLVAAGDTFRAAATEQLVEWCNRSGVRCIQGGAGSDPAALAYRALETAEAEQDQLLLIDTAGRLHTKGELMAELGKIERVLKKRDPASPHQVILVLDATIGQTALKQVEIFNRAVKLTGLIVTKLDGTARAGIVVALSERFSLPILAIGMGEELDDLQDFDANHFARALLGLEEET
ncbi:MAG: signal recognition particle-docking protein FtsY [Alphaproteobacteria bacterium]|nr:signal recognition particle-docking protein FtsY [Alphaproteobacteria bacterium]